MFIFFFSCWNVFFWNSKILIIIKIIILPPFAFTCHQIFTVAILTICFFCKRFLDTSSFHIYNSLLNILH